MGEALKQYRSVDIWERVSDDTWVRFRCFEVLPEQRYCVQSADFFHKPVNDADIQRLDRQFLELLLDVPPDERDDTFPTLAEAIAQHKADFGL